MRVRHPDAGPGESVDVDGDSRPVEDGTFRVAEDESSWLDRWCQANGFDREDVLVSAQSGASADSSPDATQESDDPDADAAGTCQAVKNDGEVCGRDLPCPYHSEDD